jgi:hypothetical protein
MFEDLVIMFGKMVQRLVEPGTSFFGDTATGFDDDVVLLSRVVGSFLKTEIDKPRSNFK